MSSKKPRNKKYNPIRDKSKHISAVLNAAMHKFYVMGDMNHSPASFHISEINSRLKGMDLKIALQQVTQFLYSERKLWHFAVFHFFDVDGKLEVIPTNMKIENTLLNEVGDDAEENIRLLKESIIDSEPGLTEENYIFYGYYINYGSDLLMSAMEEDIIAAFLKVNNDFTDIKPNVVTCTAEKILRAIANEKFSLVNSKALSTNMVEEVV